MADQSVFPLWLLSGSSDGVEWAFTECQISGIVRRVERRTNAFTGRRFVWAELETYGATLDLLAGDDENAVGFAPGAVFHGECTMIGRIVTPG